MSGETFEAVISVSEGENTIVAIAIDSTGSVQSSITLTLDTPPTVTIDSPPDGFVTTASVITIVGGLNDLVIGSINGDQVQVKVDNVDASVSNRAYLAEDVPLVTGENVITAVATDKAGNTAFASITVILEEVVGTGILTTVSGNNQSGSIGALLVEPLVVMLQDENGDPAIGETVIFEVTDNNGTLSNSPEEAQSLASQTDANGVASVNWSLGSRAGAGNNRVEAIAVGFAGTAIFTATGESAVPDKINVDAGNSQVGVSGEVLEKPLVAVVTDAGHNRLEGISVTFTVTEGGGNIDGESSVTIETDSDGRVLAMLTLGPEDGFDNNVVDADFAGNSGLAATFVATGRIPGDPSQTIVSGVVLDNTNQPVPGVTMHIEGTDLYSQADAQGQFALQPAPVGDVHLVADGSTALREGNWPRLVFEMVTVAGQDNTLGMPIFMLPLDLDKGLFVDENTGGVLTLDEVPGFSMTIAPNSVTFPGGGKSGSVSVTVVHSDKIPMVPNFGQQPRFVVTIQPSGAIFDPPAPITIPNVDGLAPDEVTEMYSFDHDLGQFVSIGTGTVSGDGLIIASDPGFGILKGGWHCGGNPSQTGSAEPVHVKITTPSDETPPEGDPPGGTLPGSPVPATPTPTPTETPPQVITMAVDDMLTIQAEGGPSPGEYSWESSDSSVVEIIGPSSGPNQSSIEIKALQGGSVNITVTYTCQSGATATDSILIEIDDGNITFILQDPNVWPKYQQNPHVYETDSSDVTNAMIQGQNETATGVNPATVNDDNFEFKMKQPEDSDFSLHNDDSSEYEMMPFNDINGSKAVKIFPLIDGERVAKKEGTYMFKFWNDDDEDDPFTTSCITPGCNPASNDSGVRDFAGNMLDFIPNTQKPEPFVEITVIYEKQGEFIKVSETPKVKEISEGDY